jgi:hypothetical protein
MSVCKMWCSEDEMKFLLNYIFTFNVFTVLCIWRVGGGHSPQCEGWRERVGRVKFEEAKEKLDGWGHSDTVEGENERVCGCMDGWMHSWFKGGGGWGLEAILELLLWESKVYISWFRKVIPEILLVTFGRRTLPCNRVLTLSWRFPQAVDWLRHLTGQQEVLIGWSSDTISPISPYILVDDGWTTLRYTHLSGLLVLETSICTVPLLRL